MSFLLLSGAMLALSPVKPVPLECHYAALQALLSAKLSDSVTARAGILPSLNSPACVSYDQGIEIATLTDYLSAFDRLIPVPATRLAQAEEAKEFDYSTLFPPEVTEPEASDQDAGVSTMTALDGEAGSSVFTVMNATIPTASAPAPEWKPLLSQQARSSQFIFPLATSPYVTSPYGLRYHPVIHSFMRHEGTDFRAAVNSEVMTIADGMVVEAGYGPVTGFFITVRHADGWSSRYLHLSELHVARNQFVRKGNVIGLSGNTGRTNGPHLHLEISHNDKLVDPMSILFEQRTSAEPVTEVHHAEPPEPKPEPVDMTPSIAVIAGEGDNLQIGVRIGRKLSMYSPSEMIETEEGNWRIIKKFGKYKLSKIQTTSASGQN